MSVIRVSCLLKLHEEILQKSIVTIYVSIDGGLQPQDVVFMAIAAAFSSYTSMRPSFQCVASLWPEAEETMTTTVGEVWSTEGV